MAYVTGASEIAYNFIIDNIEKGVWRAGDRIWTEAHLCRHLGISRVAVRQAIDRLVALFIVYKKQGSGTYVREAVDFGIVSMGLEDADRDDLLDILEFRRYFEYGNIMMFVPRATAADISALEGTYSLMVRASQASDMPTFYNADYQFHDIIAKGTKKHFVYRISTALNHVLNHHQAGINAQIGPEIGLEYHRLILNCIKKNDEDLAAIYMQRHIDATIQAVQATSKKNEPPSVPVHTNQKG